MQQPLAQQPSTTPVRTAVVLATWPGNDADPLAPSAKHQVTVGGLFLAERTLRTLRAAGVARVRLVVCDATRTVADVLRGKDSLRDVAIELVDCSRAVDESTAVAAAVGDLDEPVLLTRADRVMDVATVRQFMQLAQAQPERGQVAVDGEVEVGLRYLPSGTATSHELQPVRLDAPVWHDVDSPAAARRAERRLLQAAPPPPGNRLQRALVRPLSQWLGGFMARAGLTSLHAAGTAMLAAGGAAYAAATPNYAWLMTGIALFLLSSILGATAREMDHLQLSSERRGWVHRVGDNLRFASFYAALGIGAYGTYGGPVYLWAVPAFVLVYAFTALTLLGFVRREPEALQLLRETRARERLKRGRRYGLFGRVFFAWIEDERHVFVAMALCLAGLPHVMFWLACFGLAVETFRIVRTVMQDQLDDRSDQRTSHANLILYVLGAVVLGVLIWRMPLGAVVESLSNVGVSVIWVFAAAPLWMFADTISLSNLVRHRVGIGELFYTWVVGESYNAVVPMAGLAGEPVKAKELMNWLPVEDASKAVVRAKLIHILSGPVYTAAVAAITLWLVPLDLELRTTLVTVAALLGVLGTALIVVTLSPAPTRFTNLLLRRLSSARDLRDDDLSPRLFTVSLFYKLLARALNLIEIYIIFRLLGLHPGLTELVAISAVVSAVAVIFFMVPQGLGVAEAGIAGAFVALGYPPHVGLTFGLIRRARFVFWGLTGVGIHLLATVWRGQPESQQAQRRHVR